MTKTAYSTVYVVCITDWCSSLVLCDELILTQSRKRTAEYTACGIGGVNIFNTFIRIATPILHSGYSLR